MSWFERFLLTLGVGSYTEPHLQAACSEALAAEGARPRAEKAAVPLEDWETVGLFA